MAQTKSVVEQLIHAVNHAGILVEGETHGFHIVGQDLVFPYMIITLCTSGSGRAMYDMQEMTQSKNDLGIIMPGHIMHPLDCTEDYTFISMNISTQLLSDLKAFTFSHDYAKFDFSPLCHLTDTQAQRLLYIMNLLEAIAMHSYDDLERRKLMLIAQLSIGYEFINYYRKEQDKQWEANRHLSLYSQFCDLVVTHYTEAKDVQYYANLLEVHPKYLSKVIQEMTHGMTPKDWIEQYVITQAKSLIGANPKRSIKSIAYTLGFMEPSSFHRYFKRITGKTAKEYKEMIISSSSATERSTRSQDNESSRL